MHCKIDIKEGQFFVPLFFVATTGVKYQPRNTNFKI